MGKDKLTKKQLLSNAALEKRKVQRRLSKSLPSEEITTEAINEQITHSHIDRLQNMLPPGIRTYNQFQKPMKKRHSPKDQLPFKPLKKHVLWLPLSQQNDNTLVPLTKELEKFSAYVSLDQSEEDSRANMLRELHETIMSKWPAAEINQFGSYAVGLSTFLSDLDISILGMGVDSVGEQPTVQVSDNETNNAVNNHIMFSDVTNKGLAAIKANTATGSATKKTKHHKYIDLSAEDDASAVEVPLLTTPAVEAAKEEEEVVSWVIDKKGNTNGGVSFVMTSPAPSAAAAVTVAEKKQKETIALSKGVKRKAESAAEDSQSVSVDPVPPAVEVVDLTSSPAREEEELSESNKNEMMDDDSGSDGDESSSEDSLLNEDDSDSDGDSSDCVVNLDEINRIYEREERALNDVDVDDSFDDLHDEFHGSDDEQDDEGEQDWNAEDAEEDAAALLEECGLDLSAIEAATEQDRLSGLQRGRSADRGEDDEEYYSDGDVFNIHKQNDLFKSIRMAILAAEPELCVSSIGDVDDSAADIESAVAEELPKKIVKQRIISETSSGYSSSNGGSFVDLAALNDTSSEEENDDEDEVSVEHEYVAGNSDDQMSGEDQGGDGAASDSDDEGDDFDHSLLDVGLRPGGLGGGTSFSLNTSSGGEVVDKEAEARRHKKQLVLLRAIFPHIKSMGWVSKLELRSKARVPIINLVHKNSIECDISMGVSAQDTSHIVAALKDFCGPALHILSCFLKIFLCQLDLDKPFTGGLGSYKLYVLIAYHIQQNPNLVIDKQSPNLGMLLLTFLKYFGTPRHLNCGTTIQVLTAEVSFDRTQQVVELQRTFEKAHTILHKIVKDRLHAHHAVNNDEDGEGEEEEDEGSSKNRPLIIGGDSAAPKGPKKDNQVSSSALGALIDSEHLYKIRSVYRAKCREYPLIPDTDCDSMATKIIADLERRLSFHKGAKLEDIRSLNPCLYARLRSFSSVEQAVRHLGGRDSTFAPVSAPTGPYQRARRVESVPNFNSGVAHLSGTGTAFNHRTQGDRRESGEYKFSFNGVVGNKITDLPSATNKRVNKNKSSNPSSSSQQQSRHSFGGFPRSAAESGLGGSSERKRYRDEDNFNQSVLQAFEGNKKQRGASYNKGQISNSGNGFVQNVYDGSSHQQTPKKGNNKSNASNNSSDGGSGGSGGSGNKKKMQSLSRQISEMKEKIEHTQQHRQQQGGSGKKKQRKFY